jgi:hypothetical protein
MQIEVHTAEQLVPGSSHLEVETATAKLKKYKSPDQCKEYIIVSIHKKGDKNCNNYRGISLLSTS